MENDDNKGHVVWLPYVTKTVSTSVNGETVWYANKWKNFLLKIKYFFVKPKYLKNKYRYTNNPINSSFYKKINIKNDGEK